MLPGIINILDLFNGQLAVWFQTRFLVSHLFFRWIKLAQLSLLLRSLSCQMCNLNIIRSFSENACLRLQVPATMPSGSSVTAKGIGVDIRSRWLSFGVWMAFISVLSYFYFIVVAFFCCFGTVQNQRCRLHRIPITVRGRSASSDVSSNISPSPLYIPSHHH